MIKIYKKNLYKMIFFFQKNEHVTSSWAKLDDVASRSTKLDDVLANVAT